MDDLLESQLERVDWNQFSLEQLKKIQSRVSRAIDLKQQALPTIQTQGNLNHDFGYKATLAKVFPQHVRDRLFENQSCILPISLGSKNFAPKRLQASIRWVSENFNSCLVLVGDSVYRLTLEVRGLAQPEGNESLTQALDAGQVFLQENRLWFEDYATACDFTFKSLSEIETQPNFVVYYQELQLLYQTNESFTRLVNSFAETFLSRGEQGKVVESAQQDKKQLAINYLLEESALFTCLAEEGWCVFVYPGSIKTFEEIAEGLHPGVPFFLKQMIWVSLRLKQKAIVA
jgi:tRNA-dependent cyclodipeptide synthase